MTERTIIAGSGGQGVMLLGKVLAEAAMKENKYVTWLPAYGAEVRGGTAYCMVIISDEEIGSPYINTADTLIIMNGASLEKFRARLKKNGLLIINSSLAQFNNPDKTITVVQYPFSDMAANLGNIKTANMIALGAYLIIKKTVDFKNVLATIKVIAPTDKRDLIAINKQALIKGMAL
ncbi:MAG: 2-oxoacid:acceptor oxidoreductase family protein [Candidatus Omnitrophota bacterium]